MSLENYEVIIGLEVHCQLKTATKLFSNCPYQFGAPPNRQTDVYSWACPGTLPVPNRRAIEFAVRLGLAVDAEIQVDSRWARKHYFYPDSPQGYQITQHQYPYSKGGGIDITGDSGETKRIRLHHIHLEADAGKNIHVSGDAISLVDFNRAGAPLVEIVSEPDLRSAAEAGAYMRELRRIVRYLGISDANMEEGTLRCDANVSLRKKGGQKLGTRCEIKNLNSFKFIESAIRSEMRRQADILDDGGEIVQSTMAYDTERDQTWVMRIKEDAADYLYFPEPDLPPLKIDPSWVVEIEQNLPELPRARQLRYSELGLSDYDIGVLIDEPELVSYFEVMLKEGAPAKRSCNWLTGDLLGRVNREQISMSECPFKPEALAELVNLVESKTITGSIAKKVFDVCYQEGLMPSLVIERDGYRQVDDTEEITEIVKQICDQHSQQVAAFLAGNLKIRGFFIGQVMKKTRGRANPQQVGEILDRTLESFR